MSASGGANARAKLAAKGGGQGVPCAEAIQDAIARAKATGRTRFLAWVVPLPDAGAGCGLRAHAWAGVGDRYYWERVDANELYFAWGSLEELEGEGPDRFASVRAWQRDIAARLEWTGEARGTGRAVLLGGFGFESKASADPDWKAFPAARFVLPEGIVERLAGVARCVVFARVEPGATVAAVAADLTRRLRDARSSIAEEGVDGAVEGVRASAAEGASENGVEGPEYRVRADRSHDRFRGQLRSALAEIASGRLAKLVLARSLAVEHDADFDVPGFLERLRALYPSCTLVAVGRGRDSFLAATPESLIRVEGLALETAALAGTAPRGRTPDEDLRFAAALLASEKERAEHAHVVEAIRGVLERRCAQLEVPAGPSLRALFGIQHLETAIAGRLAVPGPGEEAVDVLALVEALHPTPAVAGAPVPEAIAWLRRHEGLERGWYAAPIGWLDGEGGGAFCVGLRSALIRNGVGEAGRCGASRARLFAGVGIVAGSDPEQELVETRIKLRALLAPLTEI